MEDKLKEAYRLVLDDMLASGNNLFIGKYDAANGEHSFMHGVYLVMDWLAYKLGDTVGDEFTDAFMHNMIQSEKEAENASQHSITDSGQEK